MVLPRPLSLPPPPLATVAWARSMPPSVLQPPASRGAPFEWVEHDQTFAHGHHLPHDYRQIAASQQHPPVSKPPHHNLAHLHAQNTADPSQPALSHLHSEVQRAPDPAQSNLAQLHAHVQSATNGPQSTLAHLHGSQHTAERNIAQLHAQVHRSQDGLAQLPPQVQQNASQHSLSQLMPPNPSGANPTSPNANSQLRLHTPSLPVQPHVSQSMHDQNAARSSQPLNTGVHPNLQQLSRHYQAQQRFQAHQIQQQRLNLQRQQQQSRQMQHQSQQHPPQLAIQQSRPLRPRLPGVASSAPQSVHMPGLPQGLFGSQSGADVSELTSATLSAPGGLLQGPPTTTADVLTVPADPSQIGLSFATPGGNSQLESYAQLPAGNADFWHTVIDHTKQQQAAAAALKEQERQAAVSNTTPFKQAQAPTTPPSAQQLFTSVSPVRASSAAAAASGSRTGTSTAATAEMPTPRLQKQMLACDLCGRVFGQRGSLGRHKKAVHMGVRPFPCQTCGFCFQQRYDLRKHILSVHEHERPFACDFKTCKAAFSRRAKLRKHVTTVHLKQRDFVCEICNSAFGEKSNKTKHIRAVHLQERKYACSMCQAAFKERGHRTKHMLTQHNVHANADGTTTVAVNTSLPKPPMS